MIYASVEDRNNCMECDLKKKKLKRGEIPVKTTLTKLLLWRKKGKSKCPQQ